MDEKKDTTIQEELAAISKALRHVIRWHDEAFDELLPILKKTNDHLENISDHLDTTYDTLSENLESIAGSLKDIKDSLDTPKYTM